MYKLINRYNFPLPTIQSPIIGSSFILPPLSPHYCFFALASFFSLETFLLSLRLNINSRLTAFKSSMLQVLIFRTVLEINSSVISILVLDRRNWRALRRESSSRYRKRWYETVGFIDLSCSISSWITVVVFRVVVAVTCAVTTVKVLCLHWLTLANWWRYPNWAGLICNTSYAMYTCLAWRYLALPVRSMPGQGTVNICAKIFRSLIRPNPLQSHTHTIYSSCKKKAWTNLSSV